MTQEEKAKAYDKALEKAKDTLQKSSAKDAVKTIVYHFFPELKESEDEIIRKELIRLFNDTVWNDSSFRFYDLDKEKVIAWLEKQDKQKLTWIEEDEKVRKALKEAGYEWSEETHELKKIPNALEECEIEHIEHGKYYYCIKDYYSGGCKRASKGVVVQALRGKSMMALGAEANKYFIPVKYIVNAKPVWSEEDEYLLDETVQHLEELIRIDKAKHCACDVQYYQRDIDWLKSLKDRIGG